MADFPPFDGPGFAGFDVARSGQGHKSAMVEIRPSKGHLWVTNVRAERGLSWEAQEQWVGEVLQRQQRIAIDATGIGNAFVERLTKLHGDRVMPIVFTVDSKSQLVTGLKLALERKILHVPPDPNLRRAVLSIKRKVTEAGTITYAATESAHGHADEAWALALALRAAGVNDCFDYSAAVAGINRFLDGHVGTAFPQTQTQVLLDIARRRQG